MRPSNGALVGLLFLVTCSDGMQDHSPSNLESRARSSGVVPPSELAVWDMVSSAGFPNDRYLRAVAFDENRGMIVMFGGVDSHPQGVGFESSQETWEWSPKNGHFTNRTSDVAPPARSAASMVFDPTRRKLILFGGRASRGPDLDDTWEWDSVTGEWAEMSIGGSHPSARGQHGMVYEKGTGRVLLFGGGQGDAKSLDDTGIMLSLGDTWELDVSNHAWNKLTPAATPTARHAFGMVWDGSRNKAVLFGGMQIDVSGAAGVPKQDTWEWDPSTSTWTERTTVGDKPSPRYAHAMAFDGNRGKIMVFGGWNMSTGGALNDVWEQTPTTGVWTRRLTGAESGMPSQQMYASLVSYDAGGVLELLDGGQPDLLGSHTTWEIDPVKLAFVDRTNPTDVAPSHYDHATAYNPSTGRTYVFGGWGESTDDPIDELWAWDGTAWAQVPTDTRPALRSGTAMAYDPVRKSLILFSGECYRGPRTCNDTWEFGSDRKWTQLAPANSPPPLVSHRMVTDPTRGKILLFGGEQTERRWPRSISNEVWEWDGAVMTWTNRTPPAASGMPNGNWPMLAVFDQGRQKLVVLEQNLLWEWDPYSGGWESRDFPDALADISNFRCLTYDSLRRRVVVLVGAFDSGPWETWEIATTAPTLFVRATEPAPGSCQSLVFDSSRGVAVDFINRETWEYKVTNLGNGEGCTAAASCASGFCVDGVCCEVAGCTGACNSCNVPGSEGACARATPGAEVPGSCPVGQACDGNGGCKKKNGQACAARTECASGACADGVCCDVSCTGTCASCNQPGREGKCSPSPAGTDPEHECGRGTGVCKSTCDGVGACAWPATQMSCGDCLTCDGIGECTFPDPACDTGVHLPGFGGSGGRTSAAGGAGGSVAGTGGVGGRSLPSDGGRDVVATNSGGAGGGFAVWDGAAGGGAGSGGGAVDAASSGGAAGRAAVDGNTAVAGAGGRETSLVGGGADSLSNVGGTAGSIWSAGGGAGNLPNVGGAAGSIWGTGGAGADAEGVGGSGDLRDAPAADASRVNAQKSGCSCHVGDGHRRQAGEATPFWWLGIVFMFLWRRRRG